MSFAKYHWNPNDSVKYAFKLCYSDNLNSMLPHSHDEIELMYFYNTSGCSYFCGGENLLLASRDMVIVNPGEIHACSQWGNGCQAICMIIDQKQLHTISLYKLRFNSKIHADNSISDIMYKVKDLLFLSDIGKLEKDCRLNALTYSLLGEIVKYSSVNDAKNRSAYDLTPVFTYIEQNLANNLKISDFSKLLHLSSDRFYHIFKEQTGISPSEYIISKRIELACKLLESTDMSISEIAQECNFCTSSYFSKKFKEYMNVTPREYKTQFSRFMVF